MKIPFKSMFYAGMILVGGAGCTSTSSKPEEKKPEDIKNKLVVSMFDNRYSDGLNIQEKLVAAMADAPDSVWRMTNKDSVIIKSSEIALNRLPWDGNPYTRDLDAAQCIKAVSDSITTHIDKNGRLKLLVVAGHGSTNQMALGNGQVYGPETPITIISNFELLQGLVDLQEKLQSEGRLQGRLADNIILGGCSVFANLTPEDAETYNDFAKKLGPITGSTIDIMVMDRKYLKEGIAGNFVVFNGSGPLGTNPKLSDVEGYLSEASQPGTSGYDSREEINSKTEWTKAFNAKHTLKNTAQNTKPIKPGTAL